MVHLDKQQPPHRQCQNFGFWWGQVGIILCCFWKRCWSLGTLMWWVKCFKKNYHRAVETKLTPHSLFPIPFPATELVGDSKHCEIQFIQWGSWLCVRERLSSENTPRDAVPNIYDLNLFWYNVRIVSLQTFHGFCLQLILVTAACPQNHSPAANVKRSHQHVVFSLSNNTARGWDKLAFENPSCALFINRMFTFLSPFGEKMMMQSAFLLPNLVSFQEQKKL